MWWLMLAVAVIAFVNGVLSFYTALRWGPDVPMAYVGAISLMGAWFIGLFWLTS